MVYLNAWLFIFQIAEPESENSKPTLHVNFDPELMLLLREVHYLGGEPFLARLPEPARILLKSTDDTLLRSTATRLDTIVSRYNFVMMNMKDFEQPLFERKLTKIDEVWEIKLKHSKMCFWRVILTFACDCYLT